MKTLDEVIDLFDNGCIRPCVECPCCGMKECQEQLAAESYYLHEYQKIEEEHAENVPITWEELKQMEGKPVWVESKRYGARWYLLENVSDNCLVCIGIYGERAPYYRDDDDWQAYRKERK